MNNGLMFDATLYEPKQGKAPHPVGNNFRGVISNTDVSKNKDNTGGYLIVTLKSDAGTIDMRYNLWNPSTQAVDIARNQLSALCYATGRFQLREGNNGKELIGAQLQYDVALQDANDPKGYVEVKHIYDANGNEPGRGNAAAPVQQQPQQVAQPTQAASFNPPINQQPPQNNPPWGAPSNAPVPQEAPPNNPPWGAQPAPQQQPQQAPWGQPNIPQQAPQQSGGQEVPPWMRNG